MLQHLVYLGVLGACGALYEVICGKGGLSCVEGCIPGALGGGEVWWVGGDVAGVVSHGYRSMWTDGGEISL